MAESSVGKATLDSSAVREAIEDRVSQPNGAIISGRYRIEGVLGTGGMGTVYLVQHTHMRKRFALKMLHAETSQVPELVARFEREAVAMSRAEHPNIAIATDFGRAENGAFFLVLEYIEGYSLRNALATGPIEVPRVLHIARQIAGALERSHELGIIHRDLKPENISSVEKSPLGSPERRQLWGNLQQSLILPTQSLTTRAISMGLLARHRHPFMQSLRQARRDDHRGPVVEK